MERNTPVEVPLVSYPTADTMSDSTPQQKENPIMQSSGSRSPRLELIYKMRNSEENCIVQCRAILSRMRLVILRHKNVSNDIKDGVSELAEQFDVMERYRKSWKGAEEERLLAAGAEVRHSTELETPSVSGKRLATSPAENTPATGKKRRDQEPHDWQVVEKKGKKKRSEKAEPAKEDRVNKRNRPKKVKPEAVLIKPAKGNSYADVLRNLRTKMQPAEAVKVKGIRKTRTGDLLLEFNRGERVQTGFVEELKGTVQEAGVVTALKPMTTLEIRNLDSFTSKEEVENAVRKLLELNEDLRIKVTTPNSREQVRALVTLSEENAAILLEIGKIKTGLIEAAIRPKLSVKRCFRCLGTGHVQMDCKGPDRSNLCMRCGDPGHRISGCTGPSKCYLCMEAGRERVAHFPLSRGCPELKMTQT